MIEFTIVVPVYNTRDYLRQCIDSVINQLNSTFEIILINDGSYDGSKEICDEYSVYENIEVVHLENGGPSRARNIGMDLANGKYILFLDSDDYLNDNQILMKFSNIFNESCCDMIYGKYDGFVDEKYHDCTYKIYPKEIKLRNKDLVGLDIEEVIISLFNHGNYYSSPTIKIYRKELLDENHIRFHEGIYIEDEEWTPEVLLNSKTIFLYEDSFYHRRIRANSIMTTEDDTRQFKKILDMISIAENMIKYTSEMCENADLVEIYKEHFMNFKYGCISLMKKITSQELSDKALKEIEASFLCQ